MQSTDSPRQSKYPESSFFRALNAPFVFTPFLSDESARMPRVGNPAVSNGLDPLAIPIYTATGDWEWLNEHAFYDIHDLATLHDNGMQKTTIRACRAGDRTLAYINKSWKINARSPGIARELWLYKFPLKDLMGEYVLNLIAVRAGPSTFNLGFELPHQTFFIEPSADMPEVLKRRIMKVLQNLHAQGVCHNALSLDNILIGADGNIYFYNFNHARFIRDQPSVQLKEARNIHFALEKRRLEFQLDHDNARQKEKDRLALAIQRQRTNDIELRKHKTDPSYEPKFTKPDRTPIFTLPRFEAWVDDLDREPRRFIPPGQTLEDFEWELKRFYNTLEKMEDLDRAAGLTRSPTRAADTQAEKGPLTAQEEMVELHDEAMEEAPVMDRALKRKRSTEMEESSSSRPPVSKRLRRISQSTSGPSRSQESRQFKNEELRPGVKPVSSYDIEPSVQENNLVPQWPIVVVRDFQKQRLPEVGTALKALVKRNCDKFKDELDREKAKCEVEQKSGTSWTSIWSPLRHLLWGSRSDTDEKEVKIQDSASLPRVNPLRRHETFLYIPATLSN